MSDKDKVIGYVLIFVGIIVIVFSTFSVFGVLSGRNEPFSTFDVEAPAIPTPDVTSQLEGVQLPEGFEITGQNGPGEIKLLPDDAFNKILNSSVYYLAMMFLASSGAKIADIGVKMIKEIKIKSNAMQP